PSCHPRAHSLFSPPARRPPRSTLFPYTPLFRSRGRQRRLPAARRRPPVAFARRSDRPPGGVPDRLPGRRLRTALFRFRRQGARRSEGTPPEPKSRKNPESRLWLEKKKPHAAYSV